MTRPDDHHAAPTVPELPRRPEVTDPDADGPLWGVEQVAAYLSMSPSWVRKAAASGELPCSPMGSRVRFHPSLVKVWVLRREMENRARLAAGRRPRRKVGPGRPVPSKKRKAPGGPKK